MNASFNLVWTEEAVFDSAGTAEGCIVVDFLCRITNELCNLSLRSFSNDTSGRGERCLAGDTILPGNTKEPNKDHGIEYDTTIPINQT